MVSAILLAAGRSQRMGAFKPLLPFGEKTVVEVCVHNLKAGGVEEVVAVVGHRAEEVRAQLAEQSLRFVVNDDPTSEMGVSISRGIAEISEASQATFIALVDQPAVPPSVIEFLIRERARTGARLIIPKHNGRGGHPVLIDLCFRQELLRLDADKGLREFFHQHSASVVRVPVDSPYVVRDMDTWDDYRALHADVFGFEPPA